MNLGVFVLAGLFKNRSEDLFRACSQMFTIPTIATLQAHMDTRKCGGAKRSCPGLLQEICVQLDGTGVMGTDRVISRPEIVEELEKRHIGRLVANRVLVETIPSSTGGF